MAASDRFTWPARLSHVAVFGAYLAIAVALTWPLATGLGSLVPNDLGDPLLNAWILWWNAKAVPLTTAWWNAPAFFPAEGTLTYSEHLLGLTPLSSPIIWLTGNPQLAYNVVFLLSFPLSAMAAYLLGLELTGRRDAAFLGGLVFGFAPYRVPQIPHLQVLVSYWMPVALLGLHRYIRRGGLGWLALFGGAWLMQGLSNGYFLAFFSVLVGLWVPWFVPLREWRKAVHIGIAAAIAAIPMVPIVLKYRTVHEANGFGRGLQEIMAYSADMTSIVDASTALTVWGGMRLFHRPEGELFTGFAAIVLIVLGIVATRRSWDRVRPVRCGARLALLGGAFAMTLIAVSAEVSPWRFEFLGMSVSASSPDKPLTLALLCLVGLAFTAKPMRVGLRSRSPLAFYALAAAAMFVFALGPAPTLMGYPVVYQAPYRWLLQFPGFNTLRVPARFAMPMMACLSVAAAIAFARLAPTRPRARQVLAGAFAIAIVADTWIGGIAVRRAPAPWNIAPAEVTGALLVLPFGEPSHDVVAMYRSIGHGRPIVNGYSGNFPPWHNSLGVGLDRYDPELLDQLARLGVTQIQVETHLDPDGAWRLYALTRATLVRESVNEGYTLYDLPLLEPLPQRTFSRTVSIAAIEASINEDQIPNLTDGSTLTRWETGPQVGVEELLVDLGAAQSISAVRLTLGLFDEDYPRELIIEVSNDRADWIEVWRGGGAGPAFAAAVRAPRLLPVVFDLGDRTARFIRLRQVGSDDTYYWSIAELAVLADPQ